MKAVVNRQQLLTFHGKIIGKKFKIPDSPEER